VRTTPKGPYKRSWNFTKAKMAENKRLRGEARDARRAERALLALNKPQKRKYTRKNDIRKIKYRDLSNISRP
jgi:hypothetical protein